MNTAVIVILYNLEDCINKQLWLLKKYCPAAQRIVVDNSSADYPTEKSQAIKYWCQKHQAEYLKIHSTEADPSMSHAFACNLAWTEFSNTYDILFFCDHDLFLIKPLNLTDLMIDKKIAGLRQVRHGLEYYWPGITMINNVRIDKKLVDFYPCGVDGVRLDTGGGLYYAMKGMAPDDMMDFDEQYVENKLYSEHHNKSFSILNGGMFMHFRNGSNWKQLTPKDHEERMSTLNALLDEYIEYAEINYK